MEVCVFFITHRFPSGVRPLRKTNSRERSSVHFPDSPETDDGVGSMTLGRTNVWRSGSVWWLLTHGCFSTPTLVGYFGSCYCVGSTFPLGDIGNYYFSRERKKSSLSLSLYSLLLFSLPLVLPAWPSIMTSAAQQWEVDFARARETLDSLSGSGDEWQVRLFDSLGQCLITPAVC